MSRTFRDGGGAEGESLGVRGLLAPSLGWGVFLAVNVYLLWGAILPLSPDTSLATYDSLIGPYRFAASTSIAVVVLVLALACCVKPRLASCHRTLFYVGSSLLVVGYLLFVAASAAVPLSWVFAFSGLFVGVSNGILFLLWGAVLAQRGLSSAALILFLAGIVSGGMCIVLLLLPVTISYIILGMLISVCVHSLWGNLDLEAKDSGSAPAVGDVKGMLKELGKPLLCVVILGFVFNAIREVAFVDFGGPKGVNIVSLLGLVLVSLSIVVLLRKGRVRVLGIEQIYSPLVLIVAAVLIPVPFLPPVYRMAFVVVISCVYLPSATLLKATCVRLVEKHGVQPLVVFGFAYFGVFAGTAVGTLVGQMPRVAGGESGAMYVMGIVMVALYFIMVSLVALREKKRESAVIISMDEDSLQMRCELLAKKHAITQSELLVMILLAQHMSYSNIAKELQLSENTVRTHGKSIYRKLGIHSKQELIDLVANKR